VKTITGDLLPLSFVESENFRSLMQMTEPRYTMPSRKHLTITLIPNKVKEVDSILRAQPTDEGVYWDYWSLHPKLDASICHASLLLFSRPSYSKQDL